MSKKSKRIAMILVLVVVAFLAVDKSQMKPENWQPGTVDAVATASADGRRVVVKEVNHSGSPTALLVQLQGSRVPAAATVTVYTITAGLHDAASLEQPDWIKPVADR